MKTKLLFVTALCMLTTGQARAETLVSFGSLLNEAGLQDHVQSVLDDLQLQHGFPGATAAYMLEDGTIGAVATGFTHADRLHSMTIESRMLAASVGKTFVGATIVALDRAAMLDLDDPVSHWLGHHDWFARLANHKSMTIRQLLHHTSGLPDHVHTPAFAAALKAGFGDVDVAPPPEALISFIHDLPEHFVAGDGWSYSDTGYLLLGLVIEAATDRSYYDEIDHRFLLRMNLPHTGRSDDRQIEGLVTGHMAQDNPFGFPETTIDDRGELVWHPGLEWTGGGLASTSRDLSVWGWMLFSGHAMPVEYLDTLLTGAAIHPELPGMRYGAGVTISESGQFGPVYGHGGWIPGYVSSMRFYPDHGVAIAFQVNSDIGMMQGSPSVVDTIENALTEAVLSWTGD